MKVKIRVPKNTTRDLKRSREEIPRLFDHWREFLRRDSFTDLKILCKDDLCSGVSLHKAVLACQSSFMAQLLSDGRDETTLILPDVKKKDLLCLVKILYGEPVTDQWAPSQELLLMLDIKQLPKLSRKSKVNSSSTTCKFHSNKFSY